MSYPSQPPHLAKEDAATRGTSVAGLLTPPPSTHQLPVPSGAFENRYSSFCFSSHLSGNPYLQVTPAPPSDSNGTRRDKVFKLLVMAGKKLEDTARKASDVTGNVLTHLKTGNSVTDAVKSRVRKEAKTFTEGGHAKVFQQTFDIVPEEQLLKYYACYLSTSEGRVIGTLYLSTLRLAFCSDDPLCHSPSPGHQEWMHYKVIVHLPQLRSVNPSPNGTDPAEKYIQISTADGHEFCFMGFVSYDKALKNLEKALPHRPVHYLKAGYHIHQS